MFARDKPTYQILDTMFKSLRYVLPIILALLVLPACKKQPPTPTTDTALGGSSQTGGFGSGHDLIPANGGSMEGFGTEFGNTDSGIESLELRNTGEGIAGNSFGDRTMVEGILQPVYFGFDSSAISGAERSKLEQAASYLNNNPSEGILIEGHCDWHGTADYNLALGDRRANSARDYLATLGINDSRIETLSKGSLEAAVGLEKNQSNNDRRADLIILK